MQIEVLSRSERGAWVPRLRPCPSFLGLEPLRGLVLGRHGQERDPADWVQ